MTHADHVQWHTTVAFRSPSRAFSLNSEKIANVAKKNN